MIKKLYYSVSEGTSPYANQALEEFLLNHVAGDECILYLWQNRKTVVIGRNQNAWKECDCVRLESDGGFLARRLSGGGAVFHDTGNLNFTFLAASENYDVTRQTEVILRAVRRFGIHAERTGRNDITVDGRKFSGNAYFHTDTASCHHGTLLLRSNKNEIEKYLTVSDEKLRSKSVDSVKSRITNLCEYAPAITVDSMRKKLVDAFSETYGLPVYLYPEKCVDSTAIAAYEKKFASWNWKYGRKILFTCESGRRFSWGEVQIQLRIESGCIADAVFWSDALDTEFFVIAAQAVKGCRFSPEDIAAALIGIPVESGSCREQEKKDISGLLEGMI